jgi:hypothetical protein
MAQRRSAEKRPAQKAISGNEKATATVAFCVPVLLGGGWSISSVAN